MFEQLLNQKIFILNLRKEISKFSRSFVVARFSYRWHNVAICFIKNKVSPHQKKKKKNKLFFLRNLFSLLIFFSLAFFLLHASFSFIYSVLFIKSDKLLFLHVYKLFTTYLTQIYDSMIQIIFLYLQQFLFLSFSLSRQKIYLSFFFLGK